MTGGGFGGSVVALVEARDAAPFAESVTSAYAERTGRPGRSYVCATVDGAARWEVSVYQRWWTCGRSASSSSDCASSVSPQEPPIAQAPKPISDTSNPVFPSCRVRMARAPASSA